MLGGVERPLGGRGVTGLLDEGGEGRVGDLGCRDPELADCDGAHRALLGVEILRAHEEGAAGNVAHDPRLGPGTPRRGEHEGEGRHERLSGGGHRRYLTWTSWISPVKANGARSR
jgi:hypothetical protein